MAVRPERKLTYDDYVNFPEGERRELLDGEAFVVPSANTRHQEVLGRLFVRIATYLEQHGGGRVFISPYDTVLSDFDVVQPDILFVSDEDDDKITEANVRGTPTWLIEVLSPSHPERDRKLKLARYEQFGVPEYWVVDPIDDEISIYRLRQDAYPDPVILQVPAVARPSKPAGLAIDLADIFRR